MKVTVGNTEGLHARIVSRLVDIARRNNTLITVNKEADTSQYIRLITLGIRYGDVIDLECDSEVAMNECIKLIQGEL